MNEPDTCVELYQVDHVADRWQAPESGPETCQLGSITLPL